MKKTILNLYIWPVFTIVTLVSLLILPVLLVLNFTIIHWNKGKFVRYFIRIYGLVLVKIFSFADPVKVVDHSGKIDFPVIFVANHCSAVDPYLFGLLPYENAFISSWPFNIPIFNKIMPMAEYINSKDGWDIVNKQSKHLLHNGCSLVIWPEGHRSKDGRVKRFKKGAFQIAAQSGRPIVPVCITGSREFLPPGKSLFSPSRVKMTILPQIPIDNTECNNDKVLLIRDLARKAIENELMKQTTAESDKSLLDEEVESHSPVRTGLT